MFSCKLCEIFKCTFFTEHLRLLLKFSNNTNFIADSKWLLILCICPVTWREKNCLYFNLDAYITARKRYARKKSTCKKTRNGTCIHYNYDRIVKPGHMFAVMKHKDITTALDCQCKGKKCGRLKFCAVVKYRRSSYFVRNVFPSKMSICVSNTVEGRDWFPGKFCHKGNTQLLNENYVSKKWLTTKFQFTANCTTLEVTKLDMK